MTSLYPFAFAQTLLGLAGELQEKTWLIELLQRRETNCPE